MIILNSYTNQAGVEFQPPNLSVKSSDELDENSVLLLKEFLSKKFVLAHEEFNSDEESLLIKLLPEKVRCKLASEREGLNYNFAVKLCLLWALLGFSIAYVPFFTFGVSVIGLMLYVVLISNKGKTHWDKIYLNTSLVINVITFIINVCVISYFMS